MSIFSYIKHHSVLATTIGSVAVVTAIITGRVASTKKAADTSGTNVKHVSVVAVSAFRSDSSLIFADGVVEAHSQADLKSQIGAPVALVNVSIGDSVYAGQVLLELENSDIRAQLAASQGQYSSARQSAIDKINDAYLKGDDAVHAQIDQLILNNVGPKPRLYSYVTDPALGAKIQDTRTDLTKTFKDWKAGIDALSQSSADASVSAVIASSKSSLDKVSSLLDDISKVLADASKIAVASSLPDINSMQGIVTAARNSVSASKLSLSSADASIAGAGVQNLQAQLAKTIVKSPISGKIAALPLRIGEFAAPGQLLVTVVGGGGLEVQAYASGDDLPRLAKGAQATIAGKARGYVSSVAPSVSETNKKVEVKVTVDDPLGSGLVVGQDVPVLIEAPRGTASGQTGSPGTYRLPIQNVKIIPGAAYVYTVSASSTIVRHPVILGAVEGDFVEVKSGIQPDMVIVSPVYELEEGQQVQVQ
jgi:multidrug efflux pump subunit AcrA (membrane-fusion protein)